MFREKYLPHWTMLIMAMMWSYFQVTLGTEGVPPTINQGFSAMLGLWVGYIFKLHTQEEAKKDKTNDS